MLQLALTKLLGYPLMGKVEKQRGVYSTLSTHMQEAVYFFVLTQKQLLCRNVLDMAPKKLPNSLLCFRRQWKGGNSFSREKRLRPPFRYLRKNNTLVFKDTFKNKVHNKLTKFSKLEMKVCQSDS